MVNKLHIDKSWTLFLDRDGVINHRIPGAYVRRPEEFEFFAGVPASIARLTGRFGRIVLVTNQQGIGKDLMTKEDLATVHSEMCTALEAVGGVIDAIYFCPSLAAENPFCRKPQTGMGMQAKKDFPEIDFKKSVMVGDSLSDMGFGSALGMVNVLVKTNEETKAKLEAEGLPEGWYINFSISVLPELIKLL